LAHLNTVINSLNVFSWGTCGRGTPVRQYSSRQFLISEAPVGRLVHSQEPLIAALGTAAGGLQQCLWQLVRLAGFIWSMRATDQYQSRVNAVREHDRIIKELAREEQQISKEIRLFGDHNIVDSLFYR
jgi:hypothetical protein